VSVPAAYLTLIVIWSTTPLAIKWSGEGPGFLFGVSARMFIGALLCLALLRIMRISMPWDREARRAYLTTTMVIYGAMMCSYWAAQYIPSGLISVVFGITPVVTGIMAGMILNERGMTPAKVAGMLTGIAGLAVIYHSSLNFGPRSAYGILVMFVAVLLHSLSSVLIKRSGTHIPAIAVTTGGLLFALPMYAVTWLVFDRHVPASIPQKALLSIIYLGTFASVIGFIFYYYVLKHLDVGRIALMTLITPVTALALGHAVNGESLGPSVWAGTALILSGLALHQWREIVRHTGGGGSIVATAAPELVDSSPQDALLQEVDTQLPADANGGTDRA
jgi:drug/metabolite transporter (DMT)-like permease